METAALGSPLSYAVNSETLWEFADLPPQTQIWARIRGAMLPRATGLVSAYGPVVRCRLILQFLGLQDRLTTVRGAIRALIRLAWDVHVEREEPDL